MIAHNWGKHSHPKLFNYVMNELSKIHSIPAISSAFLRHGFATKAALIHALTPGTFPRIQLVSGLTDYKGKKVFGFTPPLVTSPPKLPNGTALIPFSICIEEILATEFQTGKPRTGNTISGKPVLKIGATILHELCHWGDWQSHGRFTDGKTIDVDGDGTPDALLEHGEDFEFEVYGALI
ncbi:MAG: hypothetical protein AB1757_29325 [Acidobacteriota bacterium]